MEIKLIPTKDILDFEEENNLKLVVKERPKHYQLPIYYASFDNTEIQKGAFLSGDFGNGNTVEEAIANYAEIISNKTLVIGAYTSARREIVCPKIYYNSKEK